MSRIIPKVSIEIESSWWGGSNASTSGEFRQNTFLRDSISRELTSFIAMHMSCNEYSILQNIMQLNSNKKRLFDAAVALATLFILAPLIMLIALAIKFESDGPIFFVQYRTGFMGRRFRMYKFRTMAVNADSIKSQYCHLNLHAVQSPDFKIKDDPRITRVGRILRKCSLDEIPQFLNVILGDMRLVGPRPTSFPAETYAAWQLSRLLVFPGLTGFWQVSGRSNITFEERVKLDCKYILEQNPVVDLIILLKTPLAVLRGDGAY